MENMWLHTGDASLTNKSICKHVGIIIPSCMWRSSPLTLTKMAAARIAQIPVLPS